MIISRELAWYLRRAHTLDAAERLIEEYRHAFSRNDHPEYLDGFSALLDEIGERRRRSAADSPRLPEALFTTLRQIERDARPNRAGEPVVSADDVVQTLTPDAYRLWWQQVKRLSRAGLLDLPNPVEWAWSITPLGQHLLNQRA